MSHSTRIRDTLFIHNGDFSGEVDVVIENTRLVVVKRTNPSLPQAPASLDLASPLLNLPDLYCRKASSGC